MSLDVSTLLDLNPDLNRAELRTKFAADGRLQIRDLLRPPCARYLYSILAECTPWGLAWQAGSDGPNFIRADALNRLTPADRGAIATKLKFIEGDDYAFLYHAYPLVTAYLERWNPGSLHEQLLEELNAPTFQQLLRDVTGMNDIVKVDGQATLYAPGDFLFPHTDQESARGRHVAYVLNVTAIDWRPQWGGYLNFLDSDWNIEYAMRPLFNSLNLFAVPQWHSVSEVTSAAPIGRFAITGWGRDR